MSKPGEPNKYEDQDIEHLRQDLQRKQRFAPRSKSAKMLVNRVFAQKGYSQVEHRDELERLWRGIVGESQAKQSRCGRIRRGVLEVYVGHSALLSELTFDKRRILKALRATAEGRTIQDLKFKLGDVK